MKFFLNKLLVFIFLGISSISLEAQIQEIGIHLGYNVNRFRLNDNVLSNQLSIFEDGVFHGGSFGVQYMVSPPRLQEVKGFNIIPSFLFEASICRCGGKVQAITTTSDQSRSLNRLTYTLYRGNYSAKFVANIKDLRLMIGPTVENNFFSGVQISRTEDVKFAGDQFALFTIGYEFGVGYKLSRTLLLSGRITGNFTDFGRETELFPTKYKLRQYRVMLHYFIWRKHKEAYWDSIRWK